MRLAMLFSMLLACAAPAFAAEGATRSGLSIGGRAAYLDADNSREGDDVFYGGAQVRLGLGEVLAVEGSADYRQARFRGRFVDVYPVQASLLAFLLPGKPVSPFILGGAGWYFTHVRVSGENDHRLGAHGGAGLNWKFHDHWSLDATYRYIWLDDIEQVGGVVGADFDDRGHMGTLGINFHF